MDNAVMDITFVCTIQSIGLHLFHHRLKESIISKIASIDETIMKLEFQMDMLQSELIQVSCYSGYKILFMTSKTNISPDISVN